jgi:hypothetical protein
VDAGPDTSTDAFGSQLCSRLVVASGAGDRGRQVQVKAACALERAQRFGDRTHDDGVSADVVREWRCGQQRRPAWVGGGAGVSVGVSETDRRHWPPERVVKFGVPGADDRIGLGEVPDDEVERGLAGVEMVSADVVAVPGLELGGQVAPKEERDLGLLRRPGGAGRRSHRRDLADSAEGHLMLPAGSKLGGEPDDAHGHPGARSRIGRVLTSRLRADPHLALTRPAPGSEEQAACASSSW